MPEQPLFFPYYVEKIATLLSSKQLEDVLHVYDELCQLFISHAEIYDDELSQIQSVLDTFYHEALFSVPEKTFLLPSIRAFDLVEAVNMRTAQPSLLAILLADFLRAAQFNTDVIECDQGNLVRINLAADQFVFIDPTSGLSLEWQHLEARLGFEHLSEPLGQNDSFDKSQDVESIRVFEAEELLFDSIKSLKSILIAHGNYETAHAYCELLIELNPDDPYLRRDRGYILEQLECKAFAADDYQFFVDNCPDDPIARMIKAELDQIKNLSRVIH